VIIDEEVGKHDDADFRRNMAAWMRTALFTPSPKARWNDRFKRAGAVLKSFSLSVDPEGTLTAGINLEAEEGFADRGSLQHDLTDLFVAVGEAAQSDNRGVVLLFDEVQLLTKQQLEALISALHRTVQRALPVTLFGAGLPQIAELAGDAKSYAERLFVFPSIGHLQDNDARLALTEPAEEEGVRWTDEALDLALVITGGYPYFLQELGYALWPLAQNNAITADDIRDALPQYEARLDSSFFRERLDRTTEMQRAYLRAMAELGRTPRRPLTWPHSWGVRHHRWRPPARNSSTWGSCTPPNTDTPPSRSRTSTSSCYGPCPDSSLLRFADARIRPFRSGQASRKALAPPQTTPRNTKASPKGGSATMTRVVLQLPRGGLFA
jgi:hypothetical protein